MIQLCGNRGTLLIVVTFLSRSEGLEGDWRYVSCSIWYKDYTRKPHNTLNYFLSQGCSLLFPRAGSSEQVICDLQEMSVCFKHSDMQLPCLKHLPWSL